jgi:uncharacterized protein YbjT (DUF2867 family)
MQESGLDWTILRPHHFHAEPAWPDRIHHKCTAWSIRPRATARSPYIDARDIAAVAAVTLTKPGHQGKKYVITGSEALSYRDATEIIGKTIGKQLRFVDETPDQSRARRDPRGISAGDLESALAISAYQRAGGKTVTITNVVSDLTGRPPRTFAEFARDYAVAFGGSPYAASSQTSTAS